MYVNQVYMGVNKKKKMKTKKKERKESGCGKHSHFNL